MPYHVDGVQVGTGDGEEIRDFDLHRTARRVLLTRLVIWLRVAVHLQVRVGGAEPPGLRGAS